MYTIFYLFWINWCNWFHSDTDINALFNRLCVSYQGKVCQFPLLQTRIVSSTPVTPARFNSLCNSHNLLVWLYFFFRLSSTLNIKVFSLKYCFKYSRSLSLSLSLAQVLGPVQFFFSCTCLCFLCNTCFFFPFVLKLSHLFLYPFPSFTEQIYERFNPSSIIDADDARLDYFCKKVMYVAFIFWWRRWICTYGV